MTSDELQAEVDRLRALCDRVREAWNRGECLGEWLIHNVPSLLSDQVDGAEAELRAAIEALGPGGGT